MLEDFNGDSIPDLAIAAPDEDLGGADAAGVVHVVYGATGAGLTTTGSQLWSQDSLDPAGLVAVNEVLLYALGQYVRGERDGCEQRSGGTG